MKNVVITGGSDGLGKAIAKILSKEYEVTIIAKDAKKLSVAASEIGCEYRVCDVRDYAQVEKTMEEIGQIDCLVNNAGIWLEGALEDTDPSRMQEVMNVNTLGTIYCTKAVTASMKQNRSGLIINVISQAGLTARSGWPVYTASKWAITGFTKAMQQELEPFNIRICGLYPGTINTELFAKSGAPKDVSSALAPDEVASTIRYMLSLDGQTYLSEIGIKRLK